LVGFLVSWSGAWFVGRAEGQLVGRAVGWSVGPVLFCLPKYNVSGL